MKNSIIDILKEWMKFFRKQNYKILLSTYEPHFVDIEMMFNVMKQGLLTQFRQEIINIRKLSGVKAIRGALTTISSENIINYWTRTISNIGWEIIKFTGNIKKIKLFDINDKY